MERKGLGIEKDLDIRIEKIVKKCLDEFQLALSKVNKIVELEDQSLIDTAGFFEED